MQVRFDTTQHKSLFAAMLLSVGMLTFSPGFADTDMGAAYAGPRGHRARMVDWQQLDLSPNQDREIQKLDTEWRGMYSQLNPQIQQDRNRLRKMLGEPQPDEARIMELQSRIQRNEDRLRREATKIFLHKKNQLSPGQKQRLHKMMKPHM